MNHDVLKACSKFISNEDYVLLRWYCLIANTKIRKISPSYVARLALALLRNMIIITVKQTTLLHTSVTRHCVNKFSTDLEVVEVTGHCNMHL